MKTIHYALAASAFLFAAPTFAGPASDSLAACLADNTTGRDRKDLARWIFAAMSAHPELRDIGSASAAARESTSRAVATLFTRLLSESCASQYRAASKADGRVAVGAAFESLGKLATQELTSNTDVQKAISEFIQFADVKKVDAALRD